MSAPADRIRAPIAAPLVLLIGVAVLLARPFATGGAEARVLLFGVSYFAIGLASIAVPVGSDLPRIARPLALFVGLVAVSATAGALGPTTRAPWAVAALPLSLLAAVAEEALFRRLAYAGLLRFGTLAAIAGSATLFGLVHVPAYGWAALPVDLGAGLLFGWQRWASGTWTVPAATHAFANALVVLR